jgi:ADP-heptose:LPS heptosyltransferase
VDRLIVRPRADGLPALVRALRGSRYGLVFDFQSLPVSATLALATGAPTVGFHRRFRPYGTRVRLTDHAGSDHAADHKLDLLRAVGLRPGSFVPRLRMQLAPSPLWEGRPRGRRVAVSPVSPWPHKRWEAGPLAEAVGRIVTRLGADVVLAGGPGEAAQLDEVAGRLSDVPHRRVVLGTIRELAAFLAECDLFLGNDNGPRHIAAALGAPTIGFFRHVNPTHWTLPDPRHPVLWDRGNARGRPVRPDRFILPPLPEEAVRAAERLLAGSVVPGPPPERTPS